MKWQNPQREHSTFKEDVARIKKERPWRWRYARIKTRTYIWYWELTHWGQE